MIYTNKCYHCGNINTFDLDGTKLARWQMGDLIQDVWPDMPIDERETLISGMHPECWDEVFGELEDMESEYSD